MSEFSLDNVNSMYMDVLKEIGNIGAGNATTAIAGMLGTTMKMEVPRVLLMDATKLGDAICPEEETIVGIFLEVTNDISGSMMFLMKLPAAHFLVNKLMGRPQDYNEPFDEMDLSAHEGDWQHNSRRIFVSAFNYDKSQNTTFHSVYCCIYGRFHIKCAGNSVWTIW